VTTPYLTIDLDKIEHNTCTIVGLCREYGIHVTGVTKATCGHPDVARAMLRGGVISIADSRLENIQRLKTAGVDAIFMLLRVPALSAVEEVIPLVDVSLNSELSTLEALSDAAGRQGKIHDVILMVDLGDLREGLWQDDLIPFVQQVIKLRGIRIAGLGTNLACFGGVMPSEHNMKQLVSYASKIENGFGLELEWLSAINSSALELSAAGKMPEKINHARIGEAILLGRETIHRKPWPGTFQNAFVLNAEIIELKKKPSVPVGERGEDAFGHLPDFEDHGERLRALLNIGHEDVDIAGITPVDPRITILGASSGYLVVDVTDAESDIHLGDELAFSMNYSALLAAMTSGYVYKQAIKSGKMGTES
jgi:predicted amino acid racemase